MKFKDLKEGDLFHTGKTKERFPHKGLDGFKFKVLKKTSASTSICTKQYGFGNTRSVDVKHNHSANTEVFKVGV
jgi:hypothetical protein